MRHVLVVSQMSLLNEQPQYNNSHVFPYETREYITEIYNDSTFLMKMYDIFFILENNSIYLRMDTLNLDTWMNEGIDGSADPYLSIYGYVYTTAHTYIVISVIYRQVSWKMYIS